MISGLNNKMFAMIKQFEKTYKEIDYGKSKKSGKSAYVQTRNSLVDIYRVVVAANGLCVLDVL